MKKVMVQFGDNTSDIFASRRDGNEQFALYVGIPELYGGYLLETSGEPVTRNTFEDSDDEQSIQAVAAIVSDPSTPWEVCSEEDAEYVAEWLNTWGISK